jgi:glyoxylase-like metal-dependent hydrolase (beta-lactamase superfamily II)
MADRAAAELLGAPRQIADHVWCVALPLPLPDLQAVNAYVILGSDDVTLIDPGWAYAPSESLLISALASLGCAPADVARILVTHQHWDHYSMAVRWRDRHRAELMLGFEERHSIAAFDPDMGVHPIQVGMLHRAGAPALAQSVEALQWEPYERGVLFAPPDRWLHDGDQIDCGATTVIAHATPGHTRGHMVFNDIAHALAFTGDHLLPRITPSIAFERAPERLPLRSYLSSLKLILALPDATMLPAHGQTDRRTRSRGQELLDHHSRRLEQITELVAGGAQTALEVAVQMRWTRHERSLEHLDTVHRMTAILEVLAHLELLAAQGILVADECAPPCLFGIAQSVSETCSAG